MERKKLWDLFYPGTYTFNTGAPERMEIIFRRMHNKTGGADAMESLCRRDGF